MPRSLVVLVLLLVGNVVAWTTVPRLIAQGASSVPPVPAPTFATEQQWIVSDVTAAIAGMARFASAGSVDEIPAVAASDKPGESESTFVVTLARDRDPVRLAVADYIWSPGTYVRLAELLFATSRASDGPVVSAELDVRSALTDLRTDVLFDQNERLSTALTRDISSATAHESAALLVGALALRESSTMFADVRPALSRMAAHLAVARALRGIRQESLDGTVATVVLTVLSGRQREALELVQTVERRAASDADRAWVRALRLRITGDWRGLASPESATRIERLEHGRALRARVGIDGLLGFLEKVPPWIASTPAAYEQAITRARLVAVTSPELLTAASWSVLLQKSDLVAHPPLFPFEVAWFTPPVPAGTAFDLAARTPSTRPTA